MHDYDREILKTIDNDAYGVFFYDKEEENAVKRVLENKSPFRYYGHSLLNETEKFERECEKYFQRNYAHTVNSGTSALIMALHSFNVGPKDEVLIPGYFFSAVYSAVLLRGAIPVLVEIDESLNMDVRDLEKKITSKTKCVIAIHMDGSSCSISNLEVLCKNKNIYLLEDFSQCIGGSIGDKRIGSFGDISIASFQLNKMISSGEGGILLTDNHLFYKKMVARSDIGFTREKRKLLSSNESEYSTYGEGRRFNEVSAAIMNAQIKKLEKLKKGMIYRKEKIKRELGYIYPIQYKKNNHIDGDIATTITFLFQNPEETEIFWRIYTDTFPNKELKLFRHCDWGYHVYYNCNSLVNKEEVLPGNFPWCLVNADNYNYEKGALPCTDNILERTIGIKLPSNLNDLQMISIVKSLKILFDKYITERRRF